MYDSSETKRIKHIIEAQKLSISNTMKDITASDDRINEFSKKLKEINSQIDDLNTILNKPTENVTKLDYDFD
jgi:peptidoglycan hydrolase CwlO-like protein